VRLQKPFSAAQPERRPRSKALETLMQQSIGSELTVLKRTSRLRLKTARGKNCFNVISVKSKEPEGHQRPNTTPEFTSMNISSLPIIDSSQASPTSPSLLRPQRALLSINIKSLHAPPPPSASTSSGSSCNADSDTSKDDTSSSETSSRSVEGIVHSHSMKPPTSGLLFEDLTRALKIDRILNVKSTSLISFASSSSDTTVPLPLKPHPKQKPMVRPLLATSSMTLYDRVGQSFQKKRWGAGMRSVTAVQH
jgi:hypothetical protein